MDIYLVGKNFEFQKITLKNFSVAIAFKYIFLSIRAKKFPILGDLVYF